MWFNALAMLAPSVTLCSLRLPSPVLKCSHLQPPHSCRAYSSYHPSDQRLVVCGGWCGGRKIPTPWPLARLKQRIVLHLDLVCDTAMTVSCRAASASSSGLPQVVNPSLYLQQPQQSARYTVKVLLLTNNKKSFPLKHTKDFFSAQPFNS